MKIIGLCGRSGSGKGTVSSIFNSLGIPSIDTDAVYHELTNSISDCTRALALEFGEDILFNDGSLNRRALAAVVFNDENKRLSLNKIAHKFVLDECRRRISIFEDEGNSAVIVDAPLLFESGFDKECDLLVCVTSDEQARINRIVSRDSISTQQAMARIDSQLTDDYLISRCNFVIQNDSDFVSLEATVKTVAEKILC